MTAINRKLLSERISESNYTREKLAEVMQCSRGTLFNVVKGRTTPSLYIMTKLIEVLGLNQEELVEIFFPSVYRECENQ